MACRTFLRNEAKVSANAVTCSRSAMSDNGDSGWDVFNATDRVFPSAAPPSCAARFAMLSTFCSTSSLMSS